MIEVTSIEGLLRLADRHSRMVLHADDDGRHAFLVEEEGTLYRYRPKALAGDEPDSPPESNAGHAGDPHATAVAWKDVRDA